MRLEIRRPEELKAFDSLRLPVEDTAEAATEVLVELASETELARTELVQTELVRTELVAELIRTELVRTKLFAELLAKLLVELLAEVLAEILEAKASLVVYCLGSSVS